MKLPVWLLGLELLGVGAGCKPTHPSTATLPTSTDSLAGAPSAARLRGGQPDTALPFVLPRVAPARTLQLGDQLCQVHTSARVDAHRQLLLRDSLAGQFNAASLATMRAVGAGYEATYTFQLRQPNGQDLFKTTLRKADFFATVGEELVTESVPANPEFVGFLPRLNALAFTVWFNSYDTDWAASALVLLDAQDGRIRYLGLNHRAQDQLPTNALTPDGRTLLTRYAVVGAQREAVDLNQPNLLVAGTRLLNARTALVVYDYATDDKGTRQPLPRANAMLLDLVDGRLLTRLHLGVTPTGYQDGRALNHQYLAQTSTHYLLSADDQSLLVMPRAQPLAYRRLRLSTLTPFSLPQRPGEVRLHLRTGVGLHPTLYVDTLTGALRCQLPPAVTLAGGQ